MWLGDHKESLEGQSFFSQGYSNLCLHKKPQRQKYSEGLTPQALTQSIESPNLKKPIQQPNAETLNHHKWEKMWRSRR
mgnify:FL=1